MDEWGFSLALVIVPYAIINQLFNQNHGGISHLLIYGLLFKVLYIWAKDEMCYSFSYNILIYLQFNLDLIGISSLRY